MWPREIRTFKFIRSRLSNAKHTIHLITINDSETITVHNSTNEWYTISSTWNDTGIWNLIYTIYNDYINKCYKISTVSNSKSIDTKDNMSIISFSI